MASFRELRDSLLLYHDEGVIDDEELLILYDLYESKNPDFPHETYPHFDLDELENSECVAEFRVQKHHIPLLAHHLQIPATFRCQQRSVGDGTEGLCMLLRRLSYPCRYGDMIPRFGRPVPVLSMVTNTVLDYIYDHHGHRMTQWTNALMNPPQLQRYADAIAAQGAPLDNCFGFVDGTVRPMRVQALKFQSVALPNGIIGNLYGPCGDKYSYPWNG